MLKLSSELAEIIMISAEESDFVNKAEHNNTQVSSPHSYQTYCFPLIFFSIYNINDIYTNAVL